MKKPKLKIKTKKKIKEATESFKNASTKKILKPDVSMKVKVDDLVPTGSTTLNLECSGRIEGAFKIGKMVNIIGDSHAGKTLLALTILAECALLKRFDNYRFIFDDVEVANEFNLEYLFGKKMAKRVELDIISRTVEDFNDNLARASKRKKPFIYILDSFDSLTSEAAVDKDDDNRKKREKGKETKGDYGDGKPKLASRLFSLRMQEINRDGSVLIIISQTRANIGFGSQFTPKTRSGGAALKFYACHELWLACRKTIKKGHRTTQTDVQTKLTKNKLTGRHGQAFFPILFDYGIDNITSCVHFMMDEGDWTGRVGACDTKGFYTGEVRASKEGKKKLPSVARIVEWVEENNKENELFSLCQEYYNVTMESLKPKRKKKY